MAREEAMNMSNEQAVQILIPLRNMMCDQNGCPISDAVFALDKAIEALSAEPKKGRWENVGMYTVECSECKAQLHELEYANFCPNCGKDMRGEEE